MLRFLLFTTLLHCALSQQYQQKVAPGVPPQNYQNYQQPPPPPPPQQQQYQQQQQQQFQPPPQQFQPPPQQYQQPQQQYQQPPPPPPQQQGHHGGGHAHHGDLKNLDPKLLNPANIAEEREHIQEHMEVPIDTSKMSEQELQFHYFKMHDADNNNKLDGCELIKSLIHWHEDHNRTIPTEDELNYLIDQILLNMDFDDDGFVAWIEYKIVGDGQNEEERTLTDEHFSFLIDLFMQRTDTDLDGFVTYEEFKTRLATQPLQEVQLTGGGHAYI